MPKVESAPDYHRQTSYRRNRMTPHHLDWKNQPSLGKSYTHSDPIPLPENINIPPQSLFELLRQNAEAEQSLCEDFETLSLILKLTLCITAQSKHAGKTFYYRSAASAGALYPTEIYVAVTEIKGLDNGIYYYDISNQALIPVRKGDFSSRITGMMTLLSQPSRVSIFLTAIFFRSAWKYRDRSYRYHLLDTGHVIENLTLGIKSLKIPFRLSYDFDDKKINHLLGLNELKEAALAIIRFSEKGFTPSNRDTEIKDLPDDVKKPSTVSANEKDYQTIQEIHEACMTIISQPVLQDHMNNNLGINHGIWEKAEVSTPRPEMIKYPEALFRRRSSRNFINSRMSKHTLISLLDVLYETDIISRKENNSCNESISAGFIAGNIKDMVPGLYTLNTQERSISPSLLGSLTEHMSEICLDQAWLKNAAIHFLFSANLKTLNNAWGPRGYRYAMMNAGRLGERLYITAAAMGLGCCGIGAYYDKDAATIIGLNDQSALMYLVAVGQVK